MTTAELSGHEDDGGIVCRRRGTFPRARSDKAGDAAWGFEGWASLLWQLGRSGLPATRALSRRTETVA